MNNIDEEAFIRECHEKEVSYTLNDIDSFIERVAVIEHDRPSDNIYKQAVFELGLNERLFDY